MKKLNGKCLLAFFEWQQNKGYENFNPKKYSLDIAKAMSNAILIEFFDSVGIKLGVIPNQRELIGHYVNAIIYDVYINFKLHSVWSSRTEATNEAIIKANELYNQNNSYLAHS